MEYTQAISVINKYKQDLARVPAGADKPEPSGAVMDAFDSVAEGIAEVLAAQSIEASADQVQTFVKSHGQFNSTSVTEHAAEYQTQLRAAERAPKAGEATGDFNKTAFERHTGRQNNEGPLASGGHGVSGLNEDTEGGEPKATRTGKR